MNIFALRRWLLLTVLFCGYSAVLLWNSFTAQTQLQTEAAIRLATDSIRRAAAIGDFIADRRNDIAGMAKSHEIVAFLDNKALGMSLKYGLNSNLDAIDYAFRELMAQKSASKLDAFENASQRLNAQKSVAKEHIYSRIAFLDEHNQALVDTGSRPLMYLDAIKANEEPQLLIEPDLKMLIVAAPVIHKNFRSGSVVAWIDIGYLSRYLVKSGANTQYWELLITTNGQEIYSPNDWPELANEVAKNLAHLPDNRLQSVTLARKGGSEKGETGTTMLAILTPVAGAPLNLVTILTEKAAYGHITSRSFLIIAGFFPILIVIGMLLLERMRRRNVELRASFVETDRRRSELQSINLELSEEIRKRAEVEDALRKKSAQMEALAVELQTSLAHVEQVNRSKSDFLANMSHEVRTPMNAIIGLSHLTLQTGLTDKQHDYLSKIDSSAKALLRIINDILDFSKIEAGKVVIESTDFNFEEVLTEVVTVTADAAHSKGLEFLLRIAPDIPSVLVGDPLRLGQVLTNLIGNAVKFTHQGEIVVSVEAERRDQDHLTLVLSVRDTGIGMTEAQLRHVFENFFQADAATTRKYGGTGLGLTISRQLVEMMGGRIAVQSRPNVGTTFSFDVRLGYREADDPRIRRDGAAGLKGKRVLVVDDNPVAIENFSKMLEQFGMVAHGARSGPAALAVIETAENQGQPYDLLMIDWVMPGMDGIELCRRIVGRWMPAPLILLATAHDADELTARQKDLPITAVLAKPVTPSRLFGAIIDVFGGSTVARRRDRSDLRARVATVAGARILLAEDNKINQMIAKKLLSGWGMRVVLAATGRQAVDAVLDDKFDLVLMDMQMPEMDGYEATRALRADQRFAELPIVAMTAHAMSGDREQCLATGMNDYLSKPIMVEQLADVLLRWLPHHPVSDDGGVAEPEEPAAAGNFSILAGALDLDFALDRAGGNLSLLSRLLREFAADHATVVEKLRACLAAGDRVAATRLAHTISGIAGTIGATTVATAANRLQDFLRAHGGDDEDAALLVAALDDSLAPVFGAIRDFGAAAATSAAAQCATPATDQAQLATSLQTLATLLAQGDASAADLLPGLGDAFARGPARALFLKLREQVDDYNFDDAQASLAALQAGLQLSAEDA